MSEKTLKSKTRCAYGSEQRSFWHACLRTIYMNRIATAGILVVFLFFAAQFASAEENLPGAETERALVIPSIAVAVNKSVVIRLPQRATRVVVTQPQIAEVVVIAPDELLINGKGVGATSLVVWTEKTEGAKE